MPSGRIMAFDVGNRRIGIALTDGLNLTAQPFITLHRTTLRADLKSIGRFIRSQQVSTLVVGDPVHADGSPSPQSAKTDLFAQALFEANPALEHHRLDERHTTQQAHELLDQGSRKRQGSSDRIARKHLIDQVAATVLLQAFLDRLNGPALLPDPDAEVSGSLG